MAKIKSESRVLEYSKEFKVMVVKLTHMDDVQIKKISDCMGLHPLMVSRWRKEVRDGKLLATDSRRVEMTLKKPTNTKKADDKTKELEKEIKRLKAENEVLKKWQGYLAEVRQKDSGS